MTGFGQGLSGSHHSSPQQGVCSLTKENLGRYDRVCLSLMGMQFVQTCNLCLRKEKLSQLNDTVNL